MPLNRCEDEGRPGWKWGDAGKCYVYTVGNEESETAARKKALAQAAAMGEFPGTGQNRDRSEPIEFRSAEVSNVDFTERIATLLAIPYDEEAIIEYGGKILRESVAPGSFNGIETRGSHVTANRDHDYLRTVGKVVAYQPANKSGLITDVYVSDTQLGNETLQLAADGVLKVSVGMLVRKGDQVIRDGKRRITRAFLDHIAFVPNPAYKGAGVLAVRQEQQLPQSTPNLDKVLKLLGRQD